MTAPADSPDADLTTASVQPRVVLRPYASALPLGLLSFAVGMFLVAGVGLHWLTGPDVVLAGLVMAAFVTPLEFAATVVAFLGRDVGAATVLGLFSTSWLATGVLHMITPSGSTSRATGLFLLAFALMLLAPTVVALMVRPLLGVMLAISTVRAALGGVYQLVGSPGWSAAEGTAALALAIVATYSGSAFLFEDALQRPLLPTWRRGPSHRAMQGGLGDQLDRLPHEVGVRHQM